MTTETTIPRQHAPWAIGLAAAKANLLPGAILWTAGVAILIAWFTWPPAQNFLQQVANLKTQYGYIYSAIATAFFAGVLPFLMQRLAHSEGERHDLGMLLFLVIFWGYKGIEVDVLYRLQSHFFGDGHDIATLAIKICVDQFVYCPTLAVPVMVLTMQWVQNRFRKESLLAPFRSIHNFRGWYGSQIIPVMISNWAVWVPAVAIIYIMPPALQLPIQNLVACMWVMMVMFMTKPTAATPAETPPAP